MGAFSEKVDYLASFTQITPCIYVQEPDKSVDSPGDSPKTIVIATWMNALPRSIAKYAAGYRQLAPQAKIILIRTSSSEFVFRPTKRAQFARLAPATDALRALAAESPVFIHMFSNGGMFAMTNLLESYQQATGRALRVSSTVIDSAPGTARLSASIKAFSYILPKSWLARLLGKILLCAYLTSAFVFGKILGKLFGVRDAVTIARQVINDHRMMRGADKLSYPRRCYIYSDTDELVDWKDVERHASDAEEKGFVVRKEKFVGSEHVAHMRADPKRYWDTVKLYLEDPASQKTLPTSN